MTATSLALATLLALVVVALAGCGLLYRQMKKLSARVADLAEFRQNLARQNPAFRDDWLKPFKLSDRKK